VRTIKFCQDIKSIVADSIESLFTLKLPIPDPIRPPDTVDAEFTIPCFTMASSLHRSPQEIAQAITSKIPQISWIESVTATGPYLNFKLSSQILFDLVIREALEQKDRYGHVLSDNPERVLVEYSSPNTNKPLHLGHIRNNVLGMAIVNLLRATGKIVIPSSILNDRGIHICKAMVAYRHFADGRTPLDEGVKGDQYVGKMYVAFDRAVKDSPGLLDEAHQMLRQWEDGDEDTISLWRKMNEWVIQGFEETYNRIGSQFELIQHESQTYLLGKDIVSDGLKQDVFYRNEDGSIWVDLSEENLDQKALLRNDGTSLYITQDLGVAVERFESLDIDRSIYVVGSEQIYHFKVLFEVLRKLGYSWADRCTHLSYGMVYLPEGKMKSREGKVVDADDLIDAMQSLSLGIMEESHIRIDPERRVQIAEAIGLGAIKYYILKFNPQKDIHFDPKKSLSFEGATGAYIQYCHARIRSVLRKAGYDASIEWDASELSEQDELSVIRTLLQLPLIIQSSAQDLNPSRLANHLWEMAKTFNVFYTNHRILSAGSDEKTQSRLALAAALAYGLKSGLKILGIEAVEEM